MKLMHPGKTSADYLTEFPESPLRSIKDMEACSKNSGLHMKEPKYRKMMSDAILGDKNPNHKSNTTTEIRKSRSPFSSDFTKYSSEEDKKTFIKSIDYDKRLTSTQLEWWLTKGYSIEEAEKLYKERQSTFTLKKCIEKHGLKDGTLKFNERQKKWKKSLYKNFKKYGDNRSPSSKFANSIIIELCSSFKIEIPKKEKWIYNKKINKAFSYDFVYKKKIIEFNGDYWHCNPIFYKPEYFNKSIQCTAEEKWKLDEIKKQSAESHGYDVLVIWENEWKNDSVSTIERCIKFLNINIKEN
jgi:hypothetical protein